jgi:hypothetical protein
MWRKSVQAADGSLSHPMTQIANATMDGPALELIPVEKSIRDFDPRLRRVEGRGVFPLTIQCHFVVANHHPAHHRPIFDDMKQKTPEVFGFQDFPSLRKRRCEKNCCDQK